MHVWEWEKFHTFQPSPQYSVHMHKLVSHSHTLSECCAVIGLASFPGSRAWTEKEEAGTHCLHMLSFPSYPRIQHKSLGTRL